MRTSEIPILIVGGGAAGTVLSLELARRGVEFRIIDRLDGPAQTSKAITVHARTLEMLERIDKRLANRYLTRGIHNRGYVMHFVKQNVRSEVRPGLDFTTLDCRYPFLLVHRQCETEEFIRDYMLVEYGLECEWHTKLVDVKQDNAGITATLVHGDDDTDREQVHCQYLVACDGVNSRVRKTLEVSQSESDYQGTVLQNLDAFLHGFPDADDYVHYCVGTNHFIMVVMLPGGFYRMLLSDRGEAADPNITPEQGFQRLLDQHFDNVSIGDVVWHSKWESRVQLAKTYRSGNIFLASDSAHVHSTTGGQGMNCCMQDAYNLGWKLALVTKGQAGPELLDSYEAERRPIAEQVIWAASSLHEIFMGHGKDISERSQRMNDPEFINAVIGRCSGISYTYRDYVEQPGSLSVIAGPVIGDRAPDVDLRDGSTLFDFTRHPDFSLIAINGNANGDRQVLEKILHRVRDRFGVLVRSQIVATEPGVEKYYGKESRSRLYLIRPDGYIGYRCLAEEAGQLESYLENLLKLT